MGIRNSIDIERSPEDVFAYLDDLATHGEWQTEIVSARVLTDGPTRVGTRCEEVRRAGGREQKITYEITEHDPPRRFAFRGLDGPIRPVGTGIVEPLDGGARARVTVDLELEGHGLMGKVLAPMARRSAEKQVPANQRRLKERMEQGGA
jgi:uncharacterized membrane protein